MCSLEKYSLSKDDLTTKAMLLHLIESLLCLDTFKFTLSLPLIHPLHDMMQNI
jgi:hypothetical protein